MNRIEELESRIKFQEAYIRYLEDNLPIKPWVEGQTVARFDWKHVGISEEKSMKGWTKPQI